MARRKKGERYPGLIKNGNLWWFRLWVPGRPERVRVSLGTPDVDLAGDIAEALDGMAKDPERFVWLERIAAGEAKAKDVFGMMKLRKLGELTVQPKAPKIVNLEPYVERYLTMLRSLGEDAPSADMMDDYDRMLRYLMPAGEPFPITDFTEANLRVLLGSVKSRRSGKPLSPTTRRMAFNMWKGFASYLRQEIDGFHDPFDKNRKWKAPKPNPARSIFFTHDRVLQVLDAMENDRARMAVTLAFGTGMEWSALARTRKLDFKPLVQQVFAHGTKNYYRDRFCYVDTWAWNIVWPYAKGFLRDDMLIFGDVSYRAVLNDLQRAQIKLGWVSGLWKQREDGSWARDWDNASLKGEAHTLHDCRHSYCYNAALGLVPGEPPRDVRWNANQLGHSTITQVEKVYNRLGIDQALRIIEHKALHAARSA